MKVSLLNLSLGLAVGIPVLLSGAAWSADTSTADCLLASDASIKYDNQHRLRAERTQLLLCAAAGCPVDIRKECARRVDEVNAAIPTIIFEARDSSGNDLTDVKLTMDQEVIADRLEGIPVSVDPGPHTFSFEAARHVTAQKKVVIRQGQKNRTELIVFEGPRKPAPESTPRPIAAYPKTPLPSQSPASPLTSVAGSSQLLRSTPRQTDTSLGPQRTLALAVLAVGVGGVGAGTVFGMQAVSKRDKAQTACPTACSDRASVDLWQDAKRSGNLATGAFIVGGVGLAGAAVLWLTGGSASIAADTTVGPGEVQVAVKGRW